MYIREHDGGQTYLRPNREIVITYNARRTAQ